MYQDGHVTGRRTDREASNNTTWEDAHMYFANGFTAHMYFANGFTAHMYFANGFTAHMYFANGFTAEL